VAYLGELNHDQQRRWQRTVVIDNRQGDSRHLRLFPDDDQVPVPNDPDVVRVRLGSVGWTNSRRFGDVWLALQLRTLLDPDQIVGRLVPQGKETVRPADIVAIEVVNRLCGPCSEFALAERWYASTSLEELLGVPDSAVTKDRLYRTVDPRQGGSGRADQLGRVADRYGNSIPNKGSLERLDRGDGAGAVAPRGAIARRLKVPSSRP
jgi:hypothetical protein